MDFKIFGWAELPALLFTKDAGICGFLNPGKTFNAFSLFGGQWQLYILIAHNAACMILASQGLHLPSIMSCPREIFFV